jgi:5-oxoprolinase (ATP-hydrolysing) subunit A
LKKVDLNSDIGESMGIFKLGSDEEIVKFITSANIACGWHAGDPLVMENTIEISKKQSVSIGAHPGFMDIMGFGRRNISVSAEELESYVKYQLGAIIGIAKSKGEKIKHLKPHGSMYNLAAKDASLAKAIARAVYDIDKDIILVGLSNSEITKAGKATGLRVANEVFADRAYNSDGSLVSRNTLGAIIEDEELAVKRTIEMVKKGFVKSIEGREIEMTADTICVHGDNLQAVNFAKKIRAGLESAGLEITSMDQFIV